MRDIRRRRARAAAVVTTAAALFGSGVSAVSAAVPQAAAPRAAGPPATAPRANAPSRPAVPPSGDYDARLPATANEQATVGARAARVASAPAARTLRGRLGAEGVLDVDGLTGTPRQVARLDGFLTGPSRRPAAAVALDYVRAAPGVFRLTPADLAGLRPTRDYVDVAGIHHLSWVQTAAGLDLVGNGLKANVTRDGRLISVLGSPVPGLTAPAPVARPALAAGPAAVAAARRDLRETSTAPGRADTAVPVLFRTAGGTRRAWRTITMSAGEPAVHVFDAATGRLLYRHSLVHDAVAPSPPAPDAGAAAGGRVTEVAARAEGFAPATALVVDDYPGARHGGTARRVDLSAKGWLPPGSVSLFGNNAHTYTDLNDDDAAQPGEEVTPRAATSFEFRLRRFFPAGQPCTVWVCTWDPGTVGSWKANRARTATQNFFYVNVFHDHLLKKPIGFTEAAGNFEQVNISGQGRGRDAVLDEALDGARTGAGQPDLFHLDNANMATPPDGTAPRMQMYLFHAPGAAFPGEDPFLAVSGADEAEIVYHEYAHGLSGRLVVGPDGVEALDSQQSAAMAEGWSDWYAMDLLVAQGHRRDTAASGDLVVGEHVAAGADAIRTQPVDCPVGSASPRCPGTPEAGPGGYTYGDLGRVVGAPEPHADGEIWVETLWDLRRAVGSWTAESLVTRAMELAPAAPSYLDMRNAILQADRAVEEGEHAEAIWEVFARRGMGYFAGTVDGADVHPVEDFSLPPGGRPTGVLRGVVSDRTTAAPLAGATVYFGGHASGFAGDLAAVTDAAGRYAISGLYAGSYPDVVAAAPGYLPVIGTVTVSAGATGRRFPLLRDWAAGSGGATIGETDGDEYAALGCGTGRLIDTRQGSGWSADLPAPGRGKHAVVRLPVAVDVTGIRVDPAGSCGDDATAATGDYRVETSADGTRWVLAAAGHFGPGQTGALTPVPLRAGTGAGVRFVRYTMLSNQAAEYGLDCGATPFASGCSFVDTAELVVLGSAA